MKVIVDLCVVPIGVGVHLAPYIAACERVLLDAGLKIQLHPNGTAIEGEWGPVFAAIEACHQAVHAMGAPRIYTTVKANTRTDRDQTLEEKVASVEALLQQRPERGQREGRPESSALGPVAGLWVYTVRVEASDSLIDPLARLVSTASRSPQRWRHQSGPNCPDQGDAMITTLERPIALQCACPGCHCTVHGETAIRSGTLLFCSDACATGHPNGEPCHAGCGCECHG